MSNNNKKSVLDVTILGKEYKIGCAPDLQNSLVKAAQYLDLKMREIRDQHQIVVLDKIAVLAALHISHELLNNNSANIQAHDQNTHNKIKELNDRIIETLSHS
jgi:cell division protein ZapA